jgi:hypothetical protein
MAAEDAVGEERRDQGTFTDPEGLQRQQRADEQEVQREAGWIEQADQVAASQRALVAQEATNPAVIARLRAAYLAEPGATEEGFSRALPGLIAEHDRQRTVAEQLAAEAAAAAAAPKGADAARPR